MLTYITGPVNSGKTLEMITRISKNVYKCKNAKKPKSHTYYMHEKDSRFTKSDILQSHIKNIKMDAQRVSSGSEIVVLSKDIDIIGIDEGHFFSDIVDTVIKLRKMRKIVYLTFLNADYRQLPFDNTKELFALAPDNIVFCRGYCAHKGCTMKSSHSKLVKGNDALKGEDGSILKSAGTDVFIPVCYEHVKS